MANTSPIWDILGRLRYATPRHPAFAKWGFRRERKHFRQARELYNPGRFPPPKPGQPVSAGEDLDQAFLMGTPNQVADQIAALRDIGEMAPQHVHASTRLFGERVLPMFKRKS